MNPWHILRTLSLGPALFAGPLAFAEAMYQIPDEYESTSGTGAGMNNAGFAVNDGAAAIRANPALLAAQKQYQVTAGYHWPVVGREYYQAAVVDSKTSPVAAGVSYTGYTDDYVYAREDNEASPYDSPVIRRGQLGLAQSFGRVSLGVGATYVEGHSLWSVRSATGVEGRVKGIGLNLGLSSPLTTQLAAGLSVENASNRKIRDYAPRTYRGGLAYALSSAFTVMVDYRQRERVAEFESPNVVDLDAGEQDDETLAAEQMVLGSFTAQLQNFLRVLGSYGQALGDDRRSLSAGVAVVNKNFSLSYTFSRPYMNRTAAHQAVSLGVDMAM